MAQQVSDDGAQSVRMELSDMGRSLRRSLRMNAPLSDGSSFRRENSMERREEEDIELQWAAIERLSSYDRLKWTVYDFSDGKRVVDVTRLGALEKHVFIEKMIKHIEEDNHMLLKKFRERIDRVGLKLPTIEVRFENLSIEAECEVVDGKPLPTLWNTIRSIFFGLVKLPCSRSEDAKISIIKNVSGIIKPSRLTLLLGPPGCGKSTLQMALARKLDASLKVSGEITYNGYKLEEFVPQKTSAYISQYDLHIPEMTVRETLDFSACCQGVGSRPGLMMEVIKREKQAGIVPDLDIDTFMKAISAQGVEGSLQTDYILKILGLDICSDTIVGDVMRRGISGGEKKRLTTGEMIVGPTKTLFMDEISTGLDSSTTFQIVRYLQQLVHITDATILVSLLQPAPETFELFDDIILMAEGKIVYHGPRDYVLDFFERCGFRCPERKGAADFLQEVISKKDQAQYWFFNGEPYHYVSVDEFLKKFQSFHVGESLAKELSNPFDKTQSHKDALSFKMFSLSKWELLKACMARELLLTRRNSFIYVVKTTQLVIIAFITMTVFLRTRLKVDVVHANYYLGALFFSLIIMTVDGFPELAMTVSRLPMFYKQRDFYFYPAWAYALPGFILKLPHSLIVSIIWTCITYFVIGYSPEPGRFFCQLLLLFAMHQTSTAAFRFIASIFQTVVGATAGGAFFLLMGLLFGGFILAPPSMPGWLKWGFWLSPLTYGEVGISNNEFLAPRWDKISSANMSLGQQTLKNRGLLFDGSLYWVSVGALFGITILCNIGFTLAVTYLKAPSSSRAIISREKFPQIQEQESNESLTPDQSRAGRIVVPFEPLTMAFQDVQYFVDMPPALIEQGVNKKRLQLLQDVTGAFRPGILTALMGVSGAGKTTLLDVLSGRKTGGTIEGVITIGGFPKVQETFARISGYCEQTDIHSPQITVEESVVYSAWLRLALQIDQKTKVEFVKEVLETIELEGIKDSLVGLPSVNGLSTEQRKRLTIAVELVANPSIIFMDEPTSGLDARAAAIVMRAVKNIVETGRTVVCTIHQPSIDIFESFDELILMKKGGQIIYSGPLGQHSSRVIKYFESFLGLPKIRDNYNPATWMLEVTSTSMEKQLGIDFADLYKESSLYLENMELVKQLSTPQPGSKDLYFETSFPQNGWVQFTTCLWKQSLSYWRSPAYNLVRLFFVLAASVFLGALFWQHGKKINEAQDLFNILGSMYVAAFFWVVIELPYTFILAVVYTVITYPAMGYHWSAYKFLWYLFTMFCNLLYFCCLGMLMVSVTPNAQVASILVAAGYTLQNLFSGFIVPRPQIPKWWVWCNWICPTAWTLNGFLTSQYGETDKLH
ncbi:hypothetical protein AMTR_s00039p00224920 [Amborella trichopoda]|uniref:ABC transporter domain-containing protein n=1 Tax=Amborella trichopoda TaxID=13333 RepID=U5D0G5_AMBTC|nr:hypothetical protein AMTR_s00039p00224920 [Amborella trichopoda]